MEGNLNGWQELNIFAPNNDNYRENWVEQILGSSILESFRAYEKDIRYIWVTRYIEKYNETTPQFGYALPAAFIFQHNTLSLIRYIRLRVKLNDGETNFKEEVITKAREKDCFINHTQWYDYDVSADLGGSRFIPANKKTTEKQQRAILVAQFMDTTTRLLLNSIEETSGGLWKQERSSDQQNPFESHFESIRHLFQNSTNVPTFVQIKKIGETKLLISTPWNQPNEIDLSSIALNYGVNLRLTY